MSAPCRSHLSCQSSQPDLEAEWHGGWERGCDGPPRLSSDAASPTSVSLTLGEWLHHNEGYVSSSLKWL